MRDFQMISTSADRGVAGPTAREAGVKSAKPMLETVT